MDGQGANRGWRDEKGESLLRDSPFRVVMRFALHLLAALLLIEEDAGCHEDGTADDERLADESRAGTGCRAGVGGDRRHHGGVLCAPVTGLGECRER